jgi:hypothetical protein
VFEDTVLRKVLDLSKRKWEEGEENYTARIS